MHEHADFEVLPRGLVKGRHGEFTVRPGGGNRVRQGGPLPKRESRTRTDDGIDKITPVHECVFSLTSSFQLGAGFELSRLQPFFTQRGDLLIRVLSYAHRRDSIFPVGSHAIGHREGYFRFRFTHPGRDHEN